MKQSNQSGAALIFTLILVLVLSVMAVSMTFLSQSETWSGMNYRMVTQARYGAEAGLHTAANFLMNTYVPPANLVNYNVNVYPVTDLAGRNIYLSSLSTQAANYPDPQMQASFAAATNQTLQASTTNGATTNIRYTAAAQLLSIRQITPFGSNTPTMVMTWQITAHGDITSVSNAQAEVVTILERPITPTFSYAAFGDGNGCGTLSFGGNGTTDSYDSATLAVNGAGVATPPATFNTWGGNLGTNGNQTDAGSNVTIYGTLASPNPGYGVCSGNNVTAFTGNSLSQITGGLLQLPAPVTYATPVIPPAGATNINNSQILGPCNVTPCAYGDISLAGNDILTLTPGTYNINSIQMAGKSQLVVAPDPITGLYGPVIINVTGASQATPIKIAGNGINNPTLDPSMLQFFYAGSGSIMIAGNGASAALFYAPNANASFSGNGVLYGSVIARTLSDVGNGAIHYDLRLRKRNLSVGNYNLHSFTWNKF